MSSITARSLRCLRSEAATHYLIVDPGKPPLIHHPRQDNATILTRLFGDGVLHLDPPGLEIDIDTLFA